MFWLFAAVFLVLAVYHPGFRRFLLACAGFSLVVAAVILINDQPAQTIEQPVSQVEQIDPCANAADKRSCFFAQGAK